MTNEEKLSQTHYQPDRLWTGNRAIKEKHKITSMSKKDIKSWLAKQALWQVHISLPKEIHYPHYDVTKPDEQHQFDLAHMPHNFLKETRTSISYLVLMLHQDIGSPSPLRPKNQGRLHLC